MASTVKKPPRNRCGSVSANGTRGPTKPVAKRQFEQKDGFSVLPPNAQDYKCLVRRQLIADKARPKPTATQMRFEAVVNPAAAASSDIERQVARDRWVAQMQAKADPVQIRRAAREREEGKKESERQEDAAKRKAFEQQWYSREATRQMVQQSRTEEANINARRHWSAPGIESQLSVAHPSPEPIMPPEDVDFGAVRRRLALAGRAAVNTPPRTSANVSKPRSQSQTRSGALAVSAKLAREKLLREQEQQLRDQQQVLDTREEARDVIAEQNAEFEVSLLHDQMKALDGERDHLVARASLLREDVEVARNLIGNAERRQSRYGENPKLQSEREDAQRSQESAQAQLTEILNRLAEIEADRGAKQDLLLSYGVFCD